MGKVTLMGNYKKMVQLFEEVKDLLSANELQYVLELIQEYDTCKGPEEADSIETTIIDFCQKKLEKSS